MNIATPTWKNCPFCCAPWSVDRVCSEHQGGMIARVKATCPACKARVDAAGSGASAADANEDAVANFDAACERRAGTRREDWLITLKATKRRRFTR